MLALPRPGARRLAEDRKHNARSYAAMAAATRERLNEHFAEPNRRLYAYLGVDLRLGTGSRRRCD